MENQNHSTAGSFIHEVFSALDEAAIGYCLLREYDDVAVSKGKIEIDLLANPNDLPMLPSILASKGFVRLPSWGYAPHHFFVAYDEWRGCWVKLDVVTALRYGRPIRKFDVDLAETCLRERQHKIPHTLSPENEFITLLLHCLLDKGEFRIEHRERLRSLRKSAGRDLTVKRRVIEYIDRYSNFSWDDIEQAIDHEDWDYLLCRQAAVVRQLRGSRPITSTWRDLSTRLVRTLRPLLFAISRRGVSVALLAPDGAGKTTLSRELARDNYLRARVVYMGTNTDSASISLPTTKWLKEHVKSHRSSKLSLPLIAFKGLGFGSRVAEQWYRCGMAFYHRLRGRFVVFDRYVYDSFLAPQARTFGKRLRRWLIENTCPSPDLVIVLDAPGRVLYERKGEHTPERLEQQRQVYLGLKQKVSNMTVVDASRGADEVRRQVISLIWNCYADRVEGPRRNGAHC